MNNTAELEDDVSKIFNNRRNFSDETNHEDDTDTIHRETNHANLFDENEHPSSNDEDPDQSMGQVDEPIDLLIEYLQHLYHLNDCLLQLLQMHLK
jgi:hypothetical protein